MSEHVLHEPFGGPALDRRLAWLNEPARWSLVAGTGLRIAPDAGTDFWQRTHYGFRADSGHALLALLDGDLVMTTHVRFAPVHQYDQAGLMVRFAPSVGSRRRSSTSPTGRAASGSSSPTAATPTGRRRTSRASGVRRGSGCAVTAATTTSRRRQTVASGRSCGSRTSPKKGPRRGVSTRAAHAAAYVAEFSWLRMERAGALDTHPSV